MGNELARVDAGTDGQRDLARRALSLLFSPTEAAIAALGDDAQPAVTAALNRTADEMAPIPAASAARKEWETAMDERLRRLGAKVLPTAGDAAKVWRDAMVEALSDLPAMIALTAAKKAIHRPFRFIGEVEVAIREIADEMVSRRRVRRAVLERMQEEIRRAAAPAPALPEPVEITAEGIRAMKPEWRRLGLSAGFITQEQIDAALGDEGQRQAA